MAVDDDANNMIAGRPTLSRGPWTSAAASVPAAVPTSSARPSIKPWGARLAPRSRRTTTNVSAVPSSYEKKSPKLIAFFHDRVRLPPGCHGHGLIRGEGSQSLVESREDRYVRKLGT